VAKRVMRSVVNVLNVLVVQSVMVVPVLAVLGGAVARAQQQQQDPCVSTIPANVRAGVLAQDIAGVLQSSPTFRAQCERIASAPYLRVDLDLQQMPGTARAETVITRYEAGAIRAHVRIAFGQDYRELIAHEFEHVIEQLDGVNLRWEAEQGRAWQVDTGVFETRRASDAGRRVRRECELSDAHAANVVHDLR
jgi:hypothetical protein